MAKFMTRVYLKIDLKENFILPRVKKKKKKTCKQQ